jgi:phage-related tail protein
MSESYYGNYGREDKYYMSKEELEYNRQYDKKKAANALNLNSSFGDWLGDEPKKPRLTKAASEEAHALLDLAQKRLLTLADEMSKRTALEADEVAAEIASNRISRMAIEELDGAKQAAIKKLETDLDAREKAVGAREQQSSKVEQELDSRASHLQEELQSLEGQVAKARSTLRYKRECVEKIQAEIAQEKKDHSDKVAELREALIHLRVLEAKYGALESKADEFVDGSLLKYFDLGEEDDDDI